MLTAAAGEAVVSYECPGDAVVALEDVGSAVDRFYVWWIIMYAMLLWC